MPLTLEMINSAGEQTGKLLIDRDNIITVYTGNNGYALREFAIEYRATHKVTKHIVQKKDNFVETEKKRHDVLEHVSSYDRHKTHSHTRSVIDIVHADVEEYFKNHQRAYKVDKSLDLLISQKCIADMLVICKSYFAELDSSKEAQEIEKEYRSMKKREADIALDFDVAQEVEDNMKEIDLKNQQFPYVPPRKIELVEQNEVVRLYESDLSVEYTPPVTTSKRDIENTLKEIYFLSSSQKSTFFSSTLTSESDEPMIKNNNIK